MKTSIRIIAVTLILAFSTQVIAQDGGSDRDSFRALKATLRLSDDQVEELRILITARAEANKATKEDVNALQEELEAELGSDAPDPTAAGEIVIALRAARMEFGENERAFREGFNAMLNETQQDRLAYIRRLELYDEAAEALKRLFH